MRAGSTVRNTVSNSNLLEGFLAEPANTTQPQEFHTAVNFLQCSAARNKRNGFRSGINTLFTHCTADQNGDGQGAQQQPGFPPVFAGADGDGFDSAEGSKLNGCVVTNNARHGVNGGDYTPITDTTVHANAGWADWQYDTSPPAGVTVGRDLLHGKIYAANVGWIGLEGIATRFGPGLDSDGDGIADAWEYEMLAAAGLPWTV